MPKIPLRRKLLAAGLAGAIGLTAGVKMHEKRAAERWIERQKTEMFLEGNSIERKLNKVFEQKGIRSPWIYHWQLQSLNWKQARMLGALEKETIEKLGRATWVENEIPAPGVQKRFAVLKALSQSNQAQAEQIRTNLVYQIQKEIDREQARLDKMPKKYFTLSKTSQLPQNAADAVRNKSAQTALDTFYKYESPQKIRLVTKLTRLKSERAYWEASTHEMWKETKQLLEKSTPQERQKIFRFLNEFNKTNNFEADEYYMEVSYH